MTDEVKQKLLTILEREGFNAVLSEVNVLLEKAYDMGEINAYRYIKIRIAKSYAGKEEK